MSNDSTFDVAILGAGLGGTVLGSILAKNGFRVVLLEKESHPRFAIGEAMLPQSSMLLWIMGQRYGVPEILNLAKTETIREHVSPNCGIKRTIGFLYHDQEGKRQDPAKAHLLVPPATPINSESHLFRQDVDLYMLKAAQGYGAEYRDRVEVTEFETGEDGVRLKLDNGEELRARYLVDGSGFRSPVVTKLGLREEPSHLKTRSRSIFNHFRNVRFYDETLEEGEKPGLSAEWHHGTLHHIFDGGWFWVIPFDNGPGGENHLCSIGVTLDMTKHPERPDLTPEEEFWDIVNRYPSIAAHFAGAEPVRKWVRTGRLQYSSTTCLAERTFLLAHSYGFIDALYSRGFISTFETINALAGRLMDALRADDFSRERFDYVDRLQAAMLDANDRMVGDSYRAFSDYRLWNVWVRVWLANKLFGDFRLFRLCVKYLETQDTAVFDLLDQDPLPGSLKPGEDELTDIYFAGQAMLDAYEQGLHSAEEAAQGALAIIGQAKCLPPIHGWGDPAQRHLDFLPEKLGRFVMWGMNEAPPAIQRMFDFNPGVLGMGPPPGAPEPAQEMTVA
ncbi:MAG TPA: FAD-dependent monooxygenase [Thermoanaerobaculia bacterium]|nr:FAD-dependent monooxygenase [Thermoanaerobaculia bacterium]